MNITCLSLVLAAGCLCLCSVGSAGSTGLKNKSGVSGYRLIRLHYENAGGEKGLTTFDYDPGGRLYKAVWESFSERRSSLNHYEHDERGNLVGKYRDFSDGITSAETYEYDQKGNLIAEHFQRSDRVSGTTTYEYDQDGNVIKANCDRFTGWFSGEITYTYDNGRKMTGHITQNAQDVGSIQYTYDADGNLVREWWDFPDSWSQTFVYEYEAYPGTPPARYTPPNVFVLNDDGFRVIAEGYDYSNVLGGPTQWDYDETGKLITRRFSRTDGMTTNVSYLYDARGRLTKGYRKYNSGLSAVLTYETNESGQITQRTVKLSNGIVGTDSYKYDEDTRLVSAEYDKFDTWLSGTLTFTHGDDGEYAAGSFKSTGGPDADLAFEYDERGHLVKIQWTFTNAETQTYTFQYERP
ncbi:MAG: hypothetical protein OEW00_03330 [candidate division Zixibacteria bacterium]|nr:hypothetical protein [candidate division Zixibacteria bacterium]